MEINNADDISKSSSLFSISNELLYYFVVLVMAESFSLAASKLNMTPQGLNKAIITLENILRIQLVDREKGYKGLTLEGQLLFEKARTIFVNFKGLDQNLINLNPKKEELINISWSDLCYRDILPRALDKLTSQKPYVKFHVYEMKQAQLEKLILYGFIDIGILYNKPESGLLSFIEGKKVPYIIAGKPQPLKKWHELKYINPPKSETGVFFRHEGQIPEKVFETDGILSTIEFCEAGLAATFILESQVKENLEKGTIAEIAEPPEQVLFTPYLVFNNPATLTPAVNELVEAINGYFI
jgi:DNA-binding transcriptional LysR family regulator